MIAALIIVFREVFEAGLIIGIVLAVTRTVPRRNQWIGGGVVAGSSDATINVRAQKPGRYEFFDEYNEKVARGALVVK